MQIEEKIKSVLDILNDVNFYNIYYLKPSEDNFKEIRNNLIKNEEYEKVILIDELIKINHIGSGDEPFGSFNLINSINSINKMKITDPKDLLSVDDKLKEVKNILKEESLSLIEKRKQITKEKNPFEKEEKGYKLFNYYKNYAIDFLNNIEEEIKKL